jgi:hypothetical protein
MNVQTGHNRGEPLARLVHAEQFGHCLAQCLRAVETFGWTVGVPPVRKGAGDIRAYCRVNSPYRARN